MKNFTVIQIQPFTQTIVKNITSIVINISSVQLFTSADITVFCYDVDNTLLDVKHLTLDASNGYEYWTNDDTYIINWCRSQLGFIST